MPLLDYWPLPERVEAVMPFDAAALDDATLLAVHRPMRLRICDPTGVNTASEDDLSQALLATVSAGQSIVVQLVGGSGLGKTHLLRWLEIKARTLPNRVLHVIRTVGDATPNQLLEQILADLHGNGYDAIRKELEPRKGPANASEAREALIGWLKTALLREKAQAQQRIAEARQRSEQPPREDVHLAQWLAEGLHDLLADQETLRQFTSRGPGSPRALDRLAEQIVTSADNKVEFREEDFLKRDDVDVLRAGDSARTCAKQLMLTAAVGKQYRQLAAQLMNRLRDEASGELAASAPVPLPVLFDWLRQELRAEGRELLVILDEVDPAYGDPDSEAWPFLRALLHSPAASESESTGCALRIAIAVEWGLSSFLIPSRIAPPVEWRIDTMALESPATTVAAVVDLVGAYLEAGRRNPAAPSLAEEERQQLEAFGRSSAGQALFPFNHCAIEHLARQHLTTAEGTLALNSRAVIKSILHATLVPLRADFEEGQFPPPGFHDFTLDRLAPAVRDALEQQFSGELLARHAVLLCIWGGNPARLEDSPLYPEVYAAFGLEPPAVPIAPPAPIPEAPVPAPSETAPLTEVPAVIPEAATPENPEVRAFLDAVAHGGAPLALLTPAVVQWLLDHDEYNAFRIVRND